jgi:gas vesicle protein
MSDKKHSEWPNLEADPTKETDPKVNTGTTGDKAGDSEELTTQFRELGQRLVSTARAAWESEQRQELQQEITDGLRTVRDQLNEAVDNVRTSARSQGTTETVKEQVKKAAETARSNDLLVEMRNGLAAGLRELNEQLRRLSERLEHRDDPPRHRPSPRSSSCWRRAVPRPRRAPR